MKFRIPRFGGAAGDLIRLLREDLRLSEDRVESANAYASSQKREVEALKVELSELPDPLVGLFSDGRIRVSDRFTQEFGKPRKVPAGYVVQRAAYIRSDEYVPRHLHDEWVIKRAAEIYGSIES